MSFMAPPPALPFRAARYLGLGQLVGDGSAAQAAPGPGVTAELGRATIVCCYHRFPACLPQAARAVIGHSQPMRPVPWQWPIRTSIQAVPLAAVIPSRGPAGGWGAWGGSESEGAVRRGQSRGARAAG